MYKKGDILIGPFNNSIRPDIVEVTQVYEEDKCYDVIFYVYMLNRKFKIRQFRYYDNIFMHNKYKLASELEKILYL